MSRTPGEQDKLPGGHLVSTGQASKRKHVTACRQEGGLVNIELGHYVAAKCHENTAATNADGAA